MEQNNGFLPPDRLKANIGINLTKEFGNYRQDMEIIRSMLVSEDNLPEAQEMMKKLRALKSHLEKNRKSDKQPVLDQGRVIDAAYGAYIDEVDETMNVIQPKVNEIGKRLEEKANIEKQKRQREQEISANINNFILDYSVKIASATTNEQLLSIERLVNLEKGNKSRYEDQLSLLIERCNELTGKIAEQKVLIKEREALELEKEHAIKVGDDEKLEDLELKVAEIDSKIVDNTVYVQENAANSIIKSDENEEEIDEPKARRTSWKAEIIDVTLAVKKSKDMLRIELDPEKVRQSISTLKGAGSFNGKDELLVNGIRYYKEKTF